MAKIDRTGDDPSPEALSFEQALARVEKAVEQLESGELSLSEALTAFADGIQHLKICYQRLQQAEATVEKLLDIDQQGQPITEELEINDLSLEEKQESRSRRRSSR
ncbi:MAG: hypothetical protein KatS3mg109_1477 [Pirellulaceae bacterium]|nr:MAG: hypothetical protein KatS3mg109_1477 [Pirellulaceae bacterium]GIW93783.1 MAG: hypothetical protein KatS3mg110_1824 [Pirellulaceae bacterium]